MRLDLRELIVNPERRLPFHLELETDNLDFPSVREYLHPPVADGVVSNEAGILHMRGSITADMLCVCDRCGQEFESTKETAVDAGQEESADAEKETAVEQPESSEEEGQAKQDPDQAIAAGKPLIGTFETLDLDGNTVTEDIFSKADVTFVNVWGTFCPPCIAEMPDLEQIHQELPDNMQMIGILCDVESMDVPQYQEALEIVKETGVTYPSLIGNGSMTGLLQSVYAVPTSFFVDSNGCMIGAPVVGANLDAYKILLEELEVEYGMD